ncbi:MAG: ATP-dependent DNA helicase [Clostridium sp.]|uniref:ATP-dependent DNA helicase n=1 Tax=Clostridium sp. TaxID=1506 RepID=UPI0025C61C61|nr:ATP-dependent DNA helicase [Clostridium sp.]MCI6693895.1 ATP-dependent DNA helicase [Clostridium sp.]MDY6227956.1 ATP-dependent DNA helicase [Clostridium sp.]
MKDKIIIKDSVRGIIEYILKQGSIDDRYTGSTRALEGTLAHQKLQSNNEKIYSNYKKEVKLQKEFQIDNVILIVDGRADGIIIEGKDVYIEEIKSTMKSLILIDEDYNELHWAQAKFYAYIYSKQNTLNNIKVRLSYFNLETEEVKSFDREFNIEDLESFVFEIINEYKKWVLLKSELLTIRNESIKSLKFPFDNYRKGQKELAIACFNTIKEKAVLFAQAPTGIGKTISTIFPAVKSLGESRGDRIVYLTAKTITRTVAEESVKKLKDKSLKCKSITLTAKEKICFKEKSSCNPENCEYALNYYDKVNNVIFNILKEEDTFTREKIEEYAKKEKLCPFELSLDLSLWCDLIICDYNYAFDPRARLKRFFEDDVGNNVLLVDEGHNLVDRSRSMFSAEIYKDKILKASKVIKGKAPNLFKALNAINKYLIEIRKELQEAEVNSLYKKDEYKDLYKLLRIFMKECDEYLVKSANTEGYDEIKDLYFEIRAFISISELYSKEYVTLVEINKNDVKIKLFCVNPSKNLSKIVQGSYSTIIFSATLTPINYYIDLLGGDDKSYRMKLPSPFKKENLKIYGKPLNMRFKHRENNIDTVCNLIYNFKEEEMGNYMVFLPSYQYLNKIFERYKELYGDKNIICQGEVLTEEQRELFLNSFKIDSNILAFCVIGGVFSEGIDLPGKRLIGSIIVGVGFPKISNEGDIIKDYYEEKGFDYAYIYPGINKIMQAAGRVIRTETDKGRILLIDDRYYTLKYRSLLPREWELID